MASCGATCGITRAREREKEAARALARRLWPAGRDAQPAWSPEEPPHAAQDLAALAAALADVLPARCFVLEGGVDEASFVYVLATVEDATWVALREGTSREAPSQTTQQGLRVGLSPFGRLATLQEVIFRASLDDDGVWIEERRCAGVEDRRLQPFVRATQGVLRKERVTVLDAAFLAEPYDDTGTSVWSALFDRDAAVTTAGVFAPLP